MHKATWKYLRYYKYFHCIPENYCLHVINFTLSFKITILLKDVTSMTKEKTAKLIPNAIQISTDNEKV